MSIIPPALFVGTVPQCRGSWHLVWRAQSEGLAGSWLVMQICLGTIWPIANFAGRGGSHDVTNKDWFNHPKDVMSQQQCELWYSCCKRVRSFPQLSCCYLLKAIGGPLSSGNWPIVDRLGLSSVKCRSRCHPFPELAMPTAISFGFHPPWWFVVSPLHSDSSFSTSSGYFACGFVLKISTSSQFRCFWCCRWPILLAIERRQ